MVENVGGEMETYDEKLERKYTTLIATFETTANLNPYEIIDLEGIKTYAEEMGKINWLSQIDEIEKKFYGEGLLEFIKR